MKRKWLVVQLPKAGEQEHQVPGPFVVVARNPLHAARLARHNWPHCFSNHVRVEMRKLAVTEYGNQGRAFVSDRVGEVIPSSARFM